MFESLTCFIPLMDEKKSVFFGIPSLFDELYRFEKEHKEFHLNEYIKTLQKYGLEWSEDSLQSADVSEMDAQGVVAVLFAACRADRFCEGAFDKFAEDGYVSKWLNRLKELDDRCDGGISIQKISITELETDAIVNAANTGLQKGGGVCGAIFHAAGSELLQEACDKIGYCPVGSAAITPAFRMKSKYIIHAVGPKWKGGNSGEPEKLRGAYYSSLQLASDHGCHSIAFPLISAGIYDYPINLAWKEAIQTCEAFLTEHPNMTIIFAALNDDIIAKGNQALKTWCDSHAGKTACSSSGIKSDAPDQTSENTDIKLHYRIFVVDKGDFRIVSHYEYIAEFASRKIADNYVEYMRGKKRYSEKDIIIREVFVKRTLSGEETESGKIIGVITSYGESLPVEEYSFQ